MKSSIYLLSLLSAVEVAGQQISLDPYLEKRSSYFITENVEPFQQQAIDSISKEFDVYKVKNIDGQEYRTFRVRTSIYQFSTFDRKILFDTAHVEQNGAQLLHKDSLYLKGFLVTSTDGVKMNKKYSQLLLSAYRQETDSKYLAQEENFVQLPLKATSKFWKRNLINMGYGMSYALKHNPFVTGGGLAVGFGYAFEALHYIPIFGGAFFGRTTSDKIVIPLAGLTSLFIWKTVIYGLVLGKPLIKYYNRRINGKYKLPKEFIS